MYTTQHSACADATSIVYTCVTKWFWCVQEDNATMKIIGSIAGLMVVLTLMLMAYQLYKDHHRVKELLLNFLKHEANIAFEMASEAVDIASDVYAFTIATGTIENHEGLVVAFGVFLVPALITCDWTWLGRVWGGGGLMAKLTSYV